MTLNHKHIIGVKEIIDDPEHHKQYIIMEYAVNGSLEHLFKCKNGEKYKELIKTDPGLVKRIFR